MKRITPYMIAFVLPLGFWGGFAVAAVGFYAAVFWRRLLQLSRGPLYAALPFAAVSILAAAFGVDPRNSLPPAIGLALMVTIGLQMARLLVAQTDHRKLMLAFVVGVDVLAASVAIDYSLGVNRLPSGLFRDPALHNWAGALFALAFPLALFLIGQGRAYRIVGLFSTGALAVATSLAFSWVGMVGLAAGAATYGLLAGGARVRLLILGALIVLVSFPLWKSKFEGVMYQARLRDYSLASLEAVVRERIAIHRAGASLAMVRPVLGWGSTVHSESLAYVPGLSEAQISLHSDRSPSVNLLLASEALSRLPWRGWHAWAREDVAVSPNGSITADLLAGVGVSGQRIYQLVPAPRGPNGVYTFSVWVRAPGGAKWLGIAIRNASGGTTNLRRLDARGPAEVEGIRAVRFFVDDAWKRIAVTATFDEPPEDRILVALYLDGYYARQNADDGFYVWGAQLNSGPSALPYEPTSATNAAIDIRSLPHLHSWFIQTLFDSGALGLLALLGFLASLFWPRPGRGGVPTPVAAAALGFLLTQHLDLAVGQASIMFAFILVVAIAVQQAPRFTTRCSNATASD